MNELKSQRMLIFVLWDNEWIILGFLLLRVQTFYGQTNKIISHEHNHIQHKRACWPDSIKPDTSQILVRQISHYLIWQGYFHQSPSVSAALTHPCCLFKGQEGCLVTHCSMTQRSHTSDALGSHYRIFINCSLLLVSGANSLCVILTNTISVRLSVG